MGRGVTHHSHIYTAGELLYYLHALLWSWRKSLWFAIEGAPLGSIGLSSPALGGSVATGNEGSADLTCCDLNTIMNVTMIMMLIATKYNPQTVCRVIIMKEDRDVLLQQQQQQQQQQHSSSRRGPNIIGESVLQETVPICRCMLWIDIALKCHGHRWDATPWVTSIFWAAGNVLWMMMSRHSPCRHI